MQQAYDQIMKEKQSVLRAGGYGGAGSSSSYGGSSYGGAYGSGPGAGDPFGAGGPFGGFYTAIPTIMQVAVHRITIPRCVQQAISSATATTMRH